MSWKDLLFEKSEENQPASEMNKAEKSFVPPGSFNPGLNIPSLRPAPAYSEYTGVPQEPDERLKSHFQEVFNSLNDPKPSYHEFSAMQKAMTGLTTDASFKVAFQGCSAQGLTKQTLVTTTEHTINAIKTHLEEYNKNVQQKLQSEVAVKKQEIEKKREQMHRLQQEVAELTQQTQHREQEILMKSAAYNNYGNKLITDITQDLNLINQFI